MSCFVCMNRRIYWKKYVCKSKTCPFELNFKWIRLWLADILLFEGFSFFSSLVSIGHWSAFRQVENTLNGSLSPSIHHNECFAVYHNRVIENFRTSHNKNHGFAWIAHPKFIKTNSNKWKKRRKKQIIRTIRYDSKIIKSKPNKNRTREISSGWRYSFNNNDNIDSRRLLSGHLLFFLFLYSFI